jgi:predicted unusual protein kinase regulating ubiquinone biosynthesis (AarF/ABC1/UbiB family)
MILHNYLKQIFVDNFFHADPHPGNILLLDQGQIGYLDFGAMGRLDRATRRQMLHRFHAVVNADAEEAATAVVKLGHTAAVVDREALHWLWSGSSSSTASRGVDAGPTRSSSPPDGTGSGCRSR